jgi:hypothetical protein
MVVTAPKPWGPASAGSAADVQRALDALQAFGSTLSIKLYRVHLDPPPPVPVIPCLDHEAMLHQNVPPHVAAYLQEQAASRTCVAPRCRCGRSC